MIENILNNQYRRQEVINKLLKRRSIEDRGYITPCWIFIGSHDGHGYGKLSLGKYEKRQPVHILSARLWLENYVEYLHTLHKCDITDCFNPDHIFQGTRHDNMRDMVAKGRHWRQNARPHLR